VTATGYVYTWSKLKWKHWKHFHPSPT
jgi:hypothetical protein